MTTIVQRGSWAGWPDGVAIWLADDAAVSMFTAVATYRSETGRHDADSGPIVLPVGGGRTVAQCQEMANAFDLKRAGRSGWQATYAKYNMDPASTARPSTTSPHVSGYCADIAPAAFLNWMIANGGRFGWRRTLVAANDLRHFQYFPGTATAALNVTSLDGSTVPASLRTDSDMICIGLDQGLPTAVSFSIGVGILQRHSQARQQELAAAQAQQPGGCYWYPDENDFLRTMWNHGLGEFTLAQARALQANDHLIARAVFGAYASSSTPPPAPVMDYAALAKAVNDDAAKRMVS